MARVIDRTAKRARGRSGREPRNPFRRALQVLEVVVEGTGGVGVRETAAALRMAPSTVHRAFATLEREGLVHGNGSDGRYELGLEFLRLALRATARFSITNAALPLMRHLVDTCNETAVLSVYDPARLQMMFAATVESDHPLRYAVELNRWVPVYAGASGLAIMAFLPEDERNEIVTRSGLRPVTDKTITDVSALGRELERIRRSGYARSVGQRIPGAIGLAAPIWLPEGRVAGAVAVTVPEQRFDTRVEPTLVKLVTGYAKKITDRIGGADRTPVRARKVKR